MARDNRLGLVLALTGALALTPDALLLRLSGMEGLQMLGWRGLCMGAVFLTAWALLGRSPRRDLLALGRRAALTVLLCQFLNAILFPVGIASAPVAPVLLGVATVPVWSALLARLLHGEQAGPATWAAIAGVTAGLALAVSGDPADIFGAGALTGALCGLGVALALATNFVTLRHHPEVPVLLTIGLGALAAGALGWAVTEPASMWQGRLWAILVTGLVVLPLAFFAFAQASRLTSAANVSLLLLLETVLGPLWVWLGTGEAPGPRMIAGGALVVGTLALYILRPRRRRPAPQA